MKFMLLASLLLMSVLLLAPSSAWEIRSSLYPAQDGIVEWTADSFAGFLPSASESLRLEVAGERVEADRAVYRTSPLKTPFAHSEWGYYYSLGFMGREYYAGCGEDCRIEEPLSLPATEGSAEASLARVLRNSDEMITVSSDDPLILDDGYSLNLSAAENANGDAARPGGAKDGGRGVIVSLFRDDSPVDSQILQVPGDYLYRATPGNESGALIALHIRAAVDLPEESYYTINGLFQISGATELIKPGREFGEMSVDSANASGLILRNREPFSLLDSQVEILDGIWLNASPANFSSNRIWLARAPQAFDAHEIRGEIASGNFTWSPDTFAGFYYDMNSGTGGEEITATVSESQGRAQIDEITYQTTSQAKDFEFKNWGRYDAISFLGERCLAGFYEGPLCGDLAYNLISCEKLGRVLIDSNESRTIADGGELVLQEGLRAGMHSDESCNKVLVELYRGATVLNRDYFDIPGTYIYSYNFDGTDMMLPILALHISGVDCAQNKRILVDGIFQLSEDPIDVTEGSSTGNMQIISLSDEGIELENQDMPRILDDSLDAQLAGGFRIKAAEGGGHRYCIYSIAG